MYARASRSTETFSVRKHLEDLEDDEPFETEGFYAGEPAAPLHVRGPNVVPYTYLFLLIGIVVGWGFATDATRLQQWTSALEQVASSVSSAAQPSSSPPEPLPLNNVASANLHVAPAPAPAPQPPSAPPTSTAQPLPEVTITNAPGDKPESASTKSTAKSSASDAYAPPSASTDPYRKRAEAVGLNPDISRAVLTRLTATDYRNAGFAIQKAITTVPDDGDFTWPRTRKSGGAVFNVHFVEGAGQDCRRYVVTVTKDRWTTTAAPMEKCGVKVAYRGAAKEKTIE
jgi:surface antigen